MNKPFATTKAALSLLGCIALMLLYDTSQASSANTLIVGIDPTLAPPSPRYVAIEPPAQKRFGKTTYQQVDGGDSQEIWTELVATISSKSALDLSYEPSTSQLDFELKLAKGYFDLAYMSPIQFVSANQQGVYKALAKRKSQPAKGLVVARKDSNIKSLRDFNDKILAFPGLLGFSNSIIPRHSLQRLNIKVKPHFTASPLLALQLVLEGKLLGAAGNQESLELLPPAEREQLYIVWDTPGFTPHAFARHSRMPFYTQIRLQKALVGLIKSPEGKQLLPKIHINNGFETAKDSDWDDVAQINVPSLNNQQAYPLPDEPQNLHGKE
jgi:phosphonate transport system substrate-binding protein